MEFNAEDIEFAKAQTKETGYMIAGTVLGYAALIVIGSAIPNFSVLHAIIGVGLVAASWVMQTLK